MINKALVVTKAPFVNDNSPVKNDRVLAKILTAPAIAMRLNILMVATVMMVVTVMMMKAGTTIAKMTESMMRSSTFITMLGKVLMVNGIEFVVMMCSAFITMAVKSVMVYSALMTVAIIR
ncbi:hypothetical protein [Mesobacillus foraminis]|uniref:hypothetical protein n=1 Tax=Mesobacillus foraminis TaxID=279826 RepID=UPI0018EE6E22|nr:hypothetical protein [Mesobacillus foraminis]